MGAHGDLIPENILVHPKTGGLTGLVDWAEAERLLFGICIYGLEEFLGEITPSGFHYHPNASELRTLFWTKLARLIPSLCQEGILESGKLARELGVMLWHGIAFDNGALDRVIQGRNISEIHRLEAFMKAQVSLPQNPIEPNM